MSCLEGLNNVYRSKYECDREPAACCSTTGLQQRLVSIVDIPMQIANGFENSFYIVARAVSNIFILFTLGFTASAFVPCCLPILYVFVPLIATGYLIGVPISITLEVIKRTYCIAMDTLGIIFTDYGRNMRVSVAQSHDGRAAETTSEQLGQPLDATFDDPTANGGDLILQGINGLQDLLAALPQGINQQPAAEPSGDPT